MKKIAIVLIISISLLLCACGNGNINKADSSIESTEVTKKEFTEYEKAAVFAVKILQEHLKNPHSLEVYSIHGKNMEGEDYYFKIEYSATNNLGGTVEDKFYYCVSKDIFSSDEKEVFNGKAILSKSISLSDYLEDRRGDEKEFDVQIIMDNLDIINTEVYD